MNARLIGIHLLLAMALSAQIFSQDKDRSELPANSASPQSEGAYRVLCVGNSISRHGSNTDTIKRLQWDHVAGMAATSEDKDYAHLLAGRIEKALGRKVALSFTSLVSGGEGTAEKRLEPVKPLAAKPYDLIIIQHGEHEKSAKGESAARETYEKMVSLFDVPSSASKPFIICVGVWSPGSGGAYSGWAKTLQNMMQTVCRERSLPFVSVEEFALDPANRGWGENAGVKWHPNDRGHALYAEKVFKAFVQEAEKHGMKLNKAAIEDDAPKK
ncbi:MAG: SGNH/GDSL hydrolase family protein [Candidatus Sumerlaeota bacterium]|nr:SGNH/GDSL hydrolase family protein [Candidatus Sumerlaeota bacterium]